MDAEAYRDRLRAYQKSYASTLDSRSAVLKLHDAAVAAVRQAALAEEPIRRARLELRALRLLNVMATWIRRSAAHPDADEAVCDALAATYASASLHVHRRDYDAAILTIRGAIRE